MAEYSHSTFMRALRGLMSDIEGSGTAAARGLRRGAGDMEEFMTPGRMGAMGAYGAGAGAAAGAMYAGGNANFQEDDAREAGYGAMAGAGGGALAGLAGARGARGSARLLRVALERMLRDGAPPPTAEAGQMELIRRLEQFIAARQSLDDDDPRAPQLDMMIAELQQQLSQIS